MTHSEIERAIFLRVFHDLMKSEQTIAKEDCARVMADGSKLTAFTESKQTLGTVTKSNPKPIARVEDAAEFEDWIHATFPDRIKEVPDFGPADQVAAVLAEHAPHLLQGVRQVIPESLREQALRIAATREVPGTRIHHPEGVISVRPTGVARQLVADMLAGRVAIPAGLAGRELEDGQ
ncbi:hypothetical protein [Nocardia farcinica]|uniref:hypothetical protein n=1 Tax=Nocardia farcinica TaxID=37329 RepID=UPI0024539265|nr:hypothetical protein [Nocardia farcinica]